MGTTEGNGAIQGWDFVPKAWNWAGKGNVNQKTKPSSPTKPQHISPHKAKNHTSPVSTTLVSTYGGSVAENYGRRFWEFRTLRIACAGSGGSSKGLLHPKARCS